MYLNWCDITTVNVKTKPRRGAVAVVENPCEYFSGGPQTLAPTPHHFHGLVFEAIVAIVVVDTGKEKPVHSKLWGW